MVNDDGNKQQSKERQTHHKQHTRTIAYNEPILQNWTD